MLLVARAVALIPGQQPELAMRIALAQPVPGRDEDLERGRLRVDRLLDHAAREALVRPPFEQRRALRGLEAVRVPQRGAEVGGRLAVGTEPRRSLARRLGVLEHGGAVVGGLGVMGEPRRLPAGQRGQRRAMQADTPVGRELILDRRARDLMPERDRVAVRSQHSRRQARLELRQLVERDPLEQPDLRPRPRDRHGLEQPPRGHGQARRAGEHGVADAAGRADAAAREHLGHEERVAPGPSVQSRGINPCAVANSATAPADSGATVIRRAAFSWPSTTRSGWSRPSSSSR